MNKNIMDLMKKGFYKILYLLIVLFFTSCIELHHENEKQVDAILKDPSILKKSYEDNTFFKENDISSIEGWIEYFESYNSEYIIEFYNSFLSKKYYQEYWLENNTLESSISIRNKANEHNATFYFVLEEDKWELSSIQLSH